MSVDQLANAWRSLNFWAKWTRAIWAGHGVDDVNGLLDWKDIAVAGGFTTADAARLLSVDRSDLASWLRGSPPLIVADYQPLNGLPLLSFDALIEARAISHFLAERVPKRKLRKILSDLRRTTGQRHPLAADKKIVTDGFRLLELTDGGHLVNLANEVYAHRDLMKPALAGRVVFDGGKARYFLPSPVDLPLVRIDPRLALGRPVVVENERVAPTSSVAATAQDEGVTQAADWWKISKRAVRQAWDFEKRLAA